MNIITAVCLILSEGQADVSPSAAAVISARDGGKVPAGVQTSGSLVLSARRSVYGSASTSVEWEVEPEFLDTGNRSERGWWKEDDGSLNPVLVIGYADCPDAALIYDAKTQSKGIVVRLYVAKGDTQARDKVFIALKTNLPPPEPDPKPQPNPDPPPDTNRLLNVYIMDDVTRRESWVTKLLQDDVYWTKLYARGHEWRVFDVRSSERTPAWIKTVYPTAGATPSLILVDKDTHTGLICVDLPKTTAEVDALIRRYSSR